MTKGTNESAARWAAASKYSRSARIAYFAFMIGCLIAPVAMIRRPSGALGPIDLATMIDQCGPAVLGIPAAVAAAFILMALVRALDGPIALDLLSSKAEGAGATAIIWIAIFLAISLSLRVLWQVSNDPRHWF